MKSGMLMLGLDAHTNIDRFGGMLVDHITNAEANDMRARRAR